jgi:three-Cys-motif partner protein
MSEEEITLKEIREALRMADEKRLDPQLSEKQRELLELSALALRDAERLDIAQWDNVLNEPSEIWGGLWTQQKLNTFEKYLNAYLTIMNKWRDKQGWKLIYFDGFAGSGSKKTENDNSELMASLFENSTIGNINVYKGAAERVLDISQRGFDYYYFIDKDRESNEKLEQKLGKYKEGKHLIFRHGDANEEIKKLSTAMNSNNFASLVLLDPFGMQINWESIESLKDSRSDLWILVPTGVIVNRLLTKKGDLMCSDKLVSFFGINEDEIKREFYNKATEKTLFGEFDIYSKVEDSISKIAKLYVSRLKNIFKFVTERPLVMKNMKNVPIYHFVFASNNETAVKIAEQIIGSKNRKS